MTRTRGFGAAAAGHTLVISLSIALQTTIAGLWSFASRLPLPKVTVTTSAFAVHIAVSLCIIATAAWLFVRASRSVRGTSGRARTLTAAYSGAIYGVLSVLLAVAVFVTTKGRRVDPFALRVVVEPIVGVSPHAEFLLSTLLFALVIDACVVLGAAVASWFLVTAEKRARIWLVVDALLVVGFVIASLALPLAPPSATPDQLLAPVARLVVTFLFAARLITRLLPRVMDVIEAFGVRPLIAARHLRSKKSGFLAAISILSILAVSVSSCALTTTLSVMGGFRNDLKRKILGNNAHIAIDKERGTFEGWLPIVRRARGVSGVLGASPYASGEVMISSASNLSGAVLRGIDPDTAGQVTDLRRNMKVGSLDYLTDPKKLLELPRGSESFEPRTGAAPSKAKKGSTGGASNGATREIHQLTYKLTKGQRPKPIEEPGSAPSLQKPATEGTRRAPPNVDEYLVPPEAVPRELLPGIIVGQELARSLRLFLGDEVNVVAPLGALGPSGPIPKSRPFRVAGIFYSGMYEYDMKVAYVTLDTAQKFLGLGDAISGIEIKVADIDRAPVTAMSLKRAIRAPALRVRDWQELNKNLFGALALEKLAMFIALGIAVLVASFCIIGTLTLMVQEKARDVAIVKAMGGSDSMIVRVFVLEGGLIGLFGATLGIALGYLACFAAEHFGIRMNPEVYYIDKLPVHIDPLEFTWVGLSAVLLCLVVTIYPALLASRLRPVDALRYE